MIVLGITAASHETQSPECDFCPNSAVPGKMHTMMQRASISGGGLRLLAKQPPVDIQPPDTQAPAYVDPVQLAWMSTDASAQDFAPVPGSEPGTSPQYEISSLLLGRRDGHALGPSTVQESTSPRAPAPHLRK